MRTGEFRCLVQGRTQWSLWNTSAVELLQICFDVMPIILLIQ